MAARQRRRLGVGGGHRGARRRRARRPPSVSPARHNRGPVEPRARCDTRLRCAQGGAHPMLLAGVPRGARDIGLARAPVDARRGDDASQPLSRARCDCRVAAPGGGVRGVGARHRRGAHGDRTRHRHHRTRWPTLRVGRPAPFRADARHRARTSSRHNSILRVARGPAPDGERGRGGDCAAERRAGDARSGPDRRRRVRAGARRGSAVLQSRVRPARRARLRHLSGRLRARRHAAVGAHDLSFPRRREARRAR